MTVPCALADGAGAVTGFLFADGAIRPDTDQVRKLARSRSISVLPGFRFSGHPERRIFPPHGSKRFGIDQSAIKPSAGCLNAAKPESKTVNAT
jgi:hypothetical protein